MRASSASGRRRTISRAADQHARRAVAALQRVLGGKGGAQFGHQRVVVEAFDGAHVGAVAGDREGDAGARRRAVDLQRAGAADALLAAEMGPGQALLLAQEVGKMRARLDVGSTGLAVDDQGDRRHARDRLARCARAHGDGVQRDDRTASSIGRGRRRRRRRRAASPPRCPRTQTRAARSASSTGAPSSAPMTMRVTPRSGSSTNAAMASANSPGLRLNL